MAELLLFSSVILPLMGSMTLLVFLRGEDRHWQIIISTFAIVPSIIMTLFTIVMHPPPSTFCISWLASAGPMCMTLERSTITLILLSCLPLLIIITTKKSTIDSIVEFGLLLIGFSMMQVALVSDHFMLRYVTLEFVGLCITAAAFLLTSPDKKRWNNTRHVFINLRIGDLALLVAIFLMFTISNSFNITKNFNDASQGASDIQMLLTACLLTGTWVKMAIWPLNQWRTATETIKRSTRIWLLDICAPLLGAYLLYRSVPLLEMQQHKLFPAVLVIGYSAVISFVVQDAPRDQLRLMQRSSFQFESICLVLAGFWISQKGMWTFMLLWLLLRTVYLVWYELESRKESLGTLLRDIETVHFILAHGFSFLLVWNISNQSHMPVFITIILWSMWWTHAIYGGKKLEQYALFSGEDGGANIPESITNKVLKILLAVMVILATGVKLTGHIAAVVKGEEYSLFADHMHLRWLPILGRNFWIGLIAGGLVLLLAQQQMRHKSMFNRIRYRVKTVTRGPGNGSGRSPSDPLDFYEKMKQIFLKAAEFIYKRFERESAEKVGEGLSGVFKFLFRTVESFTSGNLWNRTLEAIVNSSRNLQQMHHGILRFNMVWLLAFIISISVFVWFWYTNGWV